MKSWIGVLHTGTVIKVNVSFGKFISPLGQLVFRKLAGFSTFACSISLNSHNNLAGKVLLPPAKDLREQNLSPFVRAPSGRDVTDLRSVCV